MTHAAATAHHLDALDELIACPNCDALLRDRDVAWGEIGSCPRCGNVLELPRRRAMTRLLMLSVAAQILLIAAVSFPFIEVGVVGMSRSATLVDTIAAYAGGLNEPLVIGLAALIIVIPTVRFLALIYVLGPMAIGEAPARYAVPAMRIAEMARPWAMAEVFIVGVAVALVKIAGLAAVTVGPAFWALIALVIVTIFKDLFMSRLTLWKTIEARGAGAGAA
ncbi:paraquat-inducible protein A [Maritimibacter sp. DP1N21-5]|uniref:paraquat-inducible protein A n=1 Tax=Maritimibacter sp. DP1N21-5 TaxID=2836867 RepID=UPI001C48886F|nr:paraquat-inducible protein A [Maritimibacter sp. DP1N21-5]MBV7410405.1 paraquat-inducible protein A [Maritimibacter sp. DP1N21-5]